MDLLNRLHHSKSCCESVREQKKPLAKVDDEGPCLVELPTGLKIAAPAPQPAVEAAPILPHFRIDFM